MRQIIATPSVTNQILNKFDLHAKKSYGQNFLVEAGIVDKIARNAIVSDRCCVIEIGPGIGALTQFLCKYACKVISYEVDHRLPIVLEETLSEYDNFQLIMQDFLEVDVAKVVKEQIDLGFDVVVAANLPYYITTPILFHLFESNADIKAITVMMQKEVADRFSANINSKDYNALSVITQYRCNVETVMKVPRNVFLPRPNVDSTVLQFTKKEKKFHFDEESFFAMVKGCFKQRRKTILNNYSDYLADKELAKSILKQVGIDEKRRSETLSMDEFIKLFEAQMYEN